MIRNGHSFVNEKIFENEQNQLFFSDGKKSNKVCCSQMMNDRNQKKPNPYQGSRFKGKK